MSVGSIYALGSDPCVLSQVPQVNSSTELVNHFRNIHRNWWKTLTPANFRNGFPLKLKKFILSTFLNSITVCLSENW